MKKRFIFLLLLMVVCGNVFSQIKDYYNDLLNKVIEKPYEFVVNKNKFRLRVIDTVEQKLIIEKYDVSWNIIDTANYFSSIKLEDINKDGFLDVIFPIEWVNDIYLFNPNKNVYVNTGEFPQDDFSEVDTVDNALKIYSDRGQYKGQFWYSELFQIKDYEKIDLGYIQGRETRNDNDEDELITTEISISKIINTNDETEIEKIDWNKKDDFDYGKYWKNNWQKFLPQKN